MAPSTAPWHLMPWGQNLTSCECCRRVDLDVDDNVGAAECGGASAFKNRMTSRIVSLLGTSRAPGKPCALRTIAFLALPSSAQCDCFSIVGLSPPVLPNVDLLNKTVSLSRSQEHFGPQKRFGHDGKSSCPS